jgi:D-alanyl-lipoteichoic acid acyltransferase DltB (MBOAT superfamily)
MEWRNWKNWGTPMALVFAFLVSGIWHGASWGFVIWGGLHGLYMACSVFYKPYQKRLHKVLGVEKTGYLKCWQIFITFNLVSFAWIFFRASNLKDALYVITNIFGSEKSLLSSYIFSLGRFEVMVLILVSIVYLIVNRIIHNDFFNNSYIIRWATYLTIFNGVMYFSAKTAGKFIYAQF